MNSIAAAFACNSPNHATASGGGMSVRSDRSSIDFAPAAAASLGLLSLLLAIGCRA